MTTLLVMLTIILAAVLVFVTAVHPQPATLTISELKRRAKKSKTYRKDLHRAEMQSVMVALLRSIRTILLVLVACTSIGALGWGWGIVLAVVIGLSYPALARVSLVQRESWKFYEQVEPSVLRFSERFQRVLLAFREPLQGSVGTVRRIHSRDDLTELIQSSPDVVGVYERELLGSALEFFGKTVNQIMTPRSVINFIKDSEFLGPLVLDELHAMGHSRLPVIAEDLDHVVGVLHLRDLLSLDIKRSTTAEKAMEKKVFYIREDDTLEHALAAFIKTRHHLFIVINRNRETVGLLTLEDVIEALIGRQIIDEDDVHEDLRAVAEQEGRRNNSAEGGVDV